MNSELCDRVIISTDENRTYLDFWPFVAYAYRTLFPGVKVTLAMITDRPSHDPLMVELREHGEVWPMAPLSTIDEYPIASQAKMIRFLAAASCGTEVCYIDDLDMIPIDRDWHIAKVASREPNSMLLIGAEVYKHDYPGQVPASMMCAEGHVFDVMIGSEPKSERFGSSTRLSVTQWFSYLHSLSTGSEDHSNIKLRSFSDEALIVQLRKQNPVKETHVERGYQTGVDTIDRSAWPYSQSRLLEGKYLAAHTARPYRSFKDGNDQIIRYIKERYNGDVLPQPLRAV